MMSTFTLQELDRDTARGVWTGKVDQYVLGLDEEIVFREISSTTSQQGAMTACNVNARVSSHRKPVLLTVAVLTVLNKAVLRTRTI